MHATSICQYYNLSSETSYYKYNIPFMGRSKGWDLSSLLARLSHIFMVLSSPQDMKKLSFFRNLHPLIAPL